MSEVKVSTGVVFEITRPPISALREINRQIRESMPKPPVVFVEEKGREEANESDPDYQAALREAYEQIAERQLDAVLILGSRVLHVPEDVPPLDSNVWEEDLETLNIPVGIGRRRYLSWARYVAAPALEDTALLIATMQALIGVSQEEVDKAIESFRSSAIWGADPVAEPVGSDTDGNRVQGTNGRRRTSVRRVERNG